MNFSNLVAEYGSPLYVYDLRQVRESYAALRDALPDGSGLFYSLKANPHPRVVEELGRQGCRAEGSSPGELTSALRAGCAASQCLYSGPGKTYDEIVAAFHRGVTHFSVDSPHDLRKVSQAAESCGTPAELLLRINPDTPVGGLGLAMTGSPSQFGADARWVRENPNEFAGTKWARITGFHVYMGTNISDVKDLLQTFETAIRVGKELADALRITLEVLDMGGGFGHPFAGPGDRPNFGGLKQPLTEILDRELEGWRQGKPQIVFESGRYLVGASGTLVATVQDVKISKGHNFVVLDTGINHLGGMAGLRRVPSIGAKLVSERPTPDAKQVTDIVGPLCSPLDYLARGAEAPPYVIGDVVAVPNVGAYGLSASLLLFLSRDAPVEIVVDGDDIVEASQFVVERRSVGVGVEQTRDLPLWLDESDVFGEYLNV